MIENIHLRKLLNGKYVSGVRPGCSGRPWSSRSEPEVTETGSGGSRIGSRYLDIDQNAL